MTDHRQEATMDHANELRRVAKELRAANHDGWPNSCDWGADEIERLRGLLRRIRGGEYAIQWWAEIDAALGAAVQPAVCECGHDRAAHTKGEPSWDYCRKCDCPQWRLADTPGAKA